MENQEAPEQWKADFSKWFAEKYLYTVNFDGKGWIAPPLGGRSQGKSVALTANVAWAAWVESRKSLCIELPEPLEFRDADYAYEGGYDSSLHYWPIQIKNAIKSQGYQVRVKGE